MTQWDTLCRAGATAPNPAHGRESNGNCCTCMYSGGTTINPNVKGETAWGTRNDACCILAAARFNRCTLEKRIKH